MSSSSNNKPKTSRRKIGGTGRGEEKPLKPKLGDFRRRGEQERALQPRRMESMRKRRGLREDQRSFFPARMDNIFENFRRDIEDIMNPWSLSPWGFTGFPSGFGMRGIRGRPDEEEMMVRTPLYDMVDKGDRYELEVEVPGIDKDKVDVKTTNDSIEISGEQSEKAEEKKRDYLYNERSYRSFYRRIPMPEEIVSSKVSAKMSNGILKIELPKKTPTRVKEEEATRVQIG